MKLRLLIGILFFVPLATRASYPWGFQEKCRAALSEAAIFTPPDSARFEVSRKRARQLFEIAIFNWEQALGGASTLPEGLHERKLLRRYAARLRTAFEIFDQSHTCPPRLRAFASLLGAWNDAEENLNPETNELRQKATLAFDPIALQAELETFAPASRNSIGRYFATRSKVILNLLKKKTLDKDEFHDLRKAMKNYLVLSLLLAEEESSEKSRVFYEYFYHLNEMLGEAHDAWVSFVQTNPPKAARGLEVKLPETLKRSLRRVVRSTDFLPWVPTDP